MDVQITRLFFIFIDVTSKRRLHIFLYGFDTHVFNRNSLYGEAALNKKNYSSHSHHSRSQYVLFPLDFITFVYDVRLVIIPLQFFL